MQVFLVYFPTYGVEYGVEAIFSTFEKAEAFMEEMHGQPTGESWITTDGSTYVQRHDKENMYIVEMTVDPD